MDEFVSNNKSFILADFIKIYSKYNSYISNYLKFYMNNDSSAEDISHDIFLKLYEKRVSSISDDPKAERCYLIAIARNRAKDHLRRKATEEKKYQTFMIEEVEFTDKFFRDIENSFIQGEIIDTLYDTINSLKAKEKEVMIDKMINNMTDCSIMKKSKVTNYTLKKMEKKFSEMVRERVQDYFTD